MTRIFRLTGVLILSAALLPGAGCKSAWINVKIENRTGVAIHEFEVQYPSATFGFDALPAGAEKDYRLKVRGSGPMQVTYTLPTGQTSRAKGPELTEHETGDVTIFLLPGGKVDFQPKLQAAS
jgi:hypothetical protein